LTVGFLLAVFGCFLFFEGIPYFISPQTLKKVMLQVVQMEDAALRRIGFLLMISGLSTVAVVRYLWKLDF